MAERSRSDIRQLARRADLLRLGLAWQMGVDRTLHEGQTRDPHQTQRQDRPIRSVVGPTYMAAFRRRRICHRSWILQGRFSQIGIIDADR